MRYLILPALAVTLAACASSPEQQKAEDEQAPEQRVQPIDAFEEVGEPSREGQPSSGDPDNLSTDIERLQDARRRYEQEQARENAERRRRQAECRQREGSKKVPIEDGSEEPAVYCQESP